MWVKATAGGRVNLDQVSAIQVAGSGSVWVGQARTPDGATLNITADFATKALAEAEIDRLILDGS